MEVSGSETVFAGFMAPVAVAVGILVAVDWTIRGTNCVIFFIPIETSQTLVVEGPITGLTVGSARLTPESSCIGVMP